MVICLRKISSAYSYLNVSNLITKKISGFCPVNFTIKKLLYHANEIHEAFEDPRAAGACVCLCRGLVHVCVCVGGWCMCVCV